ncbi:MAG TPA: hypothetical protein VE631_04770, partial [Alphaproteobacteria bacterium]|nr:hypothetical protein [Alphaproteobacteria bacterium]
MGEQPTRTLERAMAELAAVLGEATAAHFGAGTRVSGLRRMSAGASRETWAFDATAPDGAALPLILKRDPLKRDVAGTKDEDDGIEGVDSVLGVDRRTEGRLMQLAGDGGVPEPRVYFFLENDDRTSAGFVMDRIDGETLGGRIAR